MRNTYIRDNSRRFNYHRHPAAARLIAETIARCGGVVRQWPPCTGTLIKFSCLHVAVSS